MPLQLGGDGVLILELQKRRGRLYDMHMDDETVVAVDRQTFDESPYKVGSRLSPEELEALLMASEFRRAKEKVVFLLSLRSYSEQELRSKLQREFSLDAVAVALERLCELGFLNDEDYARRFAVDRMERKHYSKRRTLQELRAKGVDRETAALAVEELDTDETAKALELLRKKYYNKLNDPKSIQKVSASLARMGFDHGTIRRAIKELAQTAQDEDYLEHEEWEMDVE